MVNHQPRKAGHANEAGWLAVLNRGNWINRHVDCSLANAPATSSYATCPTPPAITLESCTKTGLSILGTSLFQNQWRLWYLVVVVNVFLSCLPSPSVSPHPPSARLDYTPLFPNPLGSPAVWPKTAHSCCTHGQDPTFPSSLPPHKSPTLPLTRPHRLPPQIVRTFVSFSLFPSPGRTGGTRSYSLRTTSTQFPLDAALHLGHGKTSTTHSDLVRIDLI